MAELGMMERLLTLMAQKKASDLFLAPGSPVQFKLNGLTVPINDQKLDPANVVSLIKEIVDEKSWRRFDEDHELNIGYGLRGVGSFRVNVFKQRGTAAAVIRYIPGDIPKFETLGLPEVLKDLIVQKRGLMLVVGSTGSGKSTTLASLLDYRNETKSGHILTLEDPIEFVFRNRRSIISQRQIGTDTVSLQVALKNAMRQAPDCIFIGEIRDIETMTAAIAYAQSGHLVVATLHANNANNALNRILTFYTPENRPVLLQDLASTLKGVVCQRLLKSSSGGRVPAVEVLLNTRHIQELIEQSRLSEIKEAMEKSMAQGSITFDQALATLLADKKISKEEALANADSATNLLWMLENKKAAPADGGESAKQGNGLASNPSKVSITQQPGQPNSEGASFSEFLLNI
jgi:twitching motility protein PilU